jgi:hypothetical protein
MGIFPYRIKTEADPISGLIVSARRITFSPCADKRCIAYRKGLDLEWPCYSPSDGQDHAYEGGSGEGWGCYE